ncbi:MAG TPA: hypothetical protein PK472_06935 [Pseudomonadota bacterium]|nr:hypothetical protein [Pseudomonadota bacterium]
MTDRRIVSGPFLLQPRAKIVSFHTANAHEAVALVGDQRVYQLCSVQRGAYIAERIGNLRRAIIDEGWISTSKTGAPSWNLAGIMVCQEYGREGGLLYTLDGSFAATMVSRADPFNMAFVGSGAEIGRAILFDALRAAKIAELRLDEIALRAMRAASEIRTDVGDGVSLWVSGAPKVLEFANIADCEAHLAGGAG